MRNYINTYSRFSEQLQGEMDNYIFYTKVTPRDIAKAYEVYKNTRLTVVQSMNKVLKSKK